MSYLDFWTQKSVFGLDQDHPKFGIILSKIRIELVVIKSHFWPGFLAITINRIQFWNTICAQNLGLFKAKSILKHTFYAQGHFTLIPSKQDYNDWMDHPDSNRKQLKVNFQALFYN